MPRSDLVNVLAELTFDESSPIERCREEWREFFDNQWSENGLQRRLFMTDSRAFCEPLGVSGLSSVPSVKWNKRWTVDSPQEAIERLILASLIPSQLHEARWWCPACRGRGWTHGGDSMCRDCDRLPAMLGTRSAPTSISEVVSLAAIGPSSLATAFEHASSLTPSRGVSWRVMTQDELAGCAVRRRNMTVRDETDLALATSARAILATKDNYLDNRYKIDIIRELASIGVFPVDGSSKVGVTLAVLSCAANRSR